MSHIKTFRDLLVWQKAMELSVSTYELARRLPREEQMSLGFQLRKSSISIPSNIAEGFGRHSTASYIQYLWIAHGSGAELQTQLLLGTRVRLIPEPVAQGLVTDAQEVARMLAGLVGSLKQSR